MLNTKVQILIKHNIYYKDNPGLIGKTNQLGNFTAAKIRVTMHRIFLQYRLIVIIRGSDYILFCCLSWIGVMGVRKHIVWDF